MSNAFSSLTQKDLMKRFNKDILILSLYIVFFLILFAQFPLKGDLPGNTDTWAALAFSNNYFNILESFFTGEDLGVFMYPVKNPHIYGESAVGSASIFLICKGLGFDDILASYFVLVMMFALTAFVCFLLTKLYVNNNYAAIFSGFCFTCSNYTLGNIDDIFIVFFGVILLCFYFLKKYFIERRTCYLYIAAVIGGLQTYFSAYLFLFLCVGGGILLIFNWKLFLEKVSTLKHLVLALFVFVTIAFPFFYTYLSHQKTTDFYDPYNPTVMAQMHSLNPADFARVLPNNLLYPHIPKTSMNLRGDLEKFMTLGVSSLPTPIRLDDISLHGRIPIDEPIYYVSSRVSASLGVFIVLLAVLGIVSGFRNKNEIIMIGIVGLCLSLGPGIIIFDRFFPGPAYPIYKYFSASGLFRMPLRAFFLTLLCVSVCAANGLMYIIRKMRSGSFRHPAVITCLAIAVFFVENIPFPLPSFKAMDYAYPPSEYLEFFKKDDVNVVLNLPSNPGIALAGDYKDLHSWARECIYMNWQTYHKKNILNGLNGYFPRSRLEVQKLIQQLPEKNVVEKFVHKYDLDFIIFHKNLVISVDKNKVLNSLNTVEHTLVKTLGKLAIPEDEMLLLDKIRKSEIFQIELETDRMVVFKPVL